MFHKLFPIFKAKKVAFETLYIRIFYHYVDLANILRQLTHLPANFFILWIAILSLSFDDPIEYNCPLIGIFTYNLRSSFLQKFLQKSRFCFTISEAIYDTIKHSIVIFSMQQNVQNILGPLWIEIYQNEKWLLEHFFAFHLSL